jgi:hypothetical protein
MLAALCAFFGGLALLQTAVELYGVLHYSVVRREPEIGIRIALGAAAACSVHDASFVNRLSHTTALFVSVCFSYLSRNSGTMFAQPLGPCVKAAEGTARATAALTRGQVGLRSHYPGQVGLEAMPHTEALFDDRNLGHHTRLYRHIKRLQMLDKYKICHPERRLSQLHRERRSRRTCGLFVAPTSFILSSTTFWPAHPAYMSIQPRAGYRQRMPALL